MTFFDIIITLFEIIGALALIWCVFHEERLVAFEEKVFSSLRRRRMRVVTVIDGRNGNSFNA